MARRRAPCPRVLALAACLALAGCAAREAPDAGLPPGALLLARTAALERLLKTAAQLTGTPLARAASALAKRLPDCAWVEAQAQSALELADALACGDASGPLSALHRERGDHDIAFALPLRESERLVGRANVAADGGLGVSLRLPDAALSGAAALLLPGAQPAGLPVLSASELLVHARVRAGERLDLASFVAPEGQASRLFQLKSGLFSGLVLDDTWEAGIYLPEPGARTPRAALALGIRERAAAVAAIEDFIARLRKSWSVRRSAFSVAGARGACLLDLNVMPDLAPCYVATERALVVGWNPASLRKALDGAGAEAGAAALLGGPGALVLDFARMEEVDARLRALVPAGTVLLPQPSYPWRRLLLNGERTRAGIELRLQLAGRESA